MKKKLFSIVELLVVIAILAVLSGIVFTAMSGFEERKQVALTQDVINTLQIGFQKYYDSYGEYPNTSSTTVPILDHNVYSKISEFIDIPKDFMDEDTANPPNVWPVDSWGNQFYYCASHQYDDVETNSTSFIPKKVSGRFRNYDTLQILSRGALTADSTDDIDNCK